MDGFEGLKTTTTTEDAMNIVPSRCNQPALSCRKYPGIYRDKRDDEIVLMVTSNTALVLQTKSPCANTIKNRKAGDVIRAVLTENDELYIGGSFTISN